MAQERVFELLACTVFTGLAVLVLWDIRDIPPPLFGPVSSADLPRAVSWIVLVLSIFVGVRTFFATQGKMRDQQPAIVATLTMIVLTALYAAAVDWGEVDFGLLSSLYLWIAIWFLARPRGARLLLLAALGLFVGCGADALFTHVLYINLP
jgi:hypothetical protein